MSSLNDKKRLYRIQKEISEVLAQSEGLHNTEETRHRIKCQIENIMENAVNEGTYVDTQVICDRSNNDLDKINNREFRMDIFFKENRTTDFIHLEYIFR